MAVVLDQTILYPQGGGQPFDTGSIETLDGTINFWVTDVRAKSGVVTSEVFTDDMNHINYSFLPVLLIRVLNVQMFLHPQVYHYGNYDDTTRAEATGFKPGDGVKVVVDGARRSLNSRFVNLPNYS